MKKEVSKFFCNKVYVVEKLGLFSLLKLYAHIHKNNVFTSYEVLYIDASSFVKLVVFWLPWANFEHLVFSSSNLYDEQGRGVRLKVNYQEMHILYKYIQKKILYGKNSREYHLRKILPGRFIGHGSGLWRSLFLIQLGLSKHITHDCANSTTLILKNQIFFDCIQEYVKERKLKIEVVHSGLSFSYVGSLLSLLKVYFRNNVLIVLLSLKSIKNVKFRVQRCKEEGRGKKIAVNNITHLNLQAPHLHSDFFFVQASELCGQKMLALVSSGSLEDFEKTVDLFEKYDIETLPLGRTAVYAKIVKYIPSFMKFKVSALGSLFSREKVEKKWLNIEAELFDLEKNIWAQLLKDHGVKAYVTWHKYSEEHCVINAAINDIDGAMLMYQRSYEGNPSPETRMCADVMFGFSNHSATVEALSGSDISYLVVTGYLGDHRFPLVREAAGKVRNQLVAKGCKYVVAFFDENSLADSRWWNGHEIPQHQYNFLLTKLLSNSELGLVLKPKNPRTLHERLGPVSHLLDDALKTGRCYLYDQGDVQGAVTPAQAALSADVAIHSSVAAATAGVEAVLAGVPTVFFDDENFIISPFYTIGKGRNVFNSWDDMWNSLENFFQNKAEDKMFGRFPEMMDHFDPFRDSRAAERMGTFLQWVIEGFERGEAKEMVLAKASKRYCECWGDDKVIENISSFSK